MHGNGPESIDQWWDACHAGRHPRTDFYLTGHQGPDVWGYLDVRQMLEPGTAVLNIGVGQGHCTRNLAALGCVVSVLDISPLALGKVKDVVSAGYLARELDLLPDDSFDVALSFLVVQHMEHAALKAQLAAVFRALKPSGLFALQYAFPLAKDAPTIEDSPERCKVGGVVRRTEDMEKEAMEVGFAVRRSWVHSEYPQYGSGWRILHLEKPA